MAHIRPYFYSIERLLDFYVASGDHTHTKWQLKPWLHEDAHNSKFHLHFTGLIPEEVRPYLQASQATILAYYTAIVLLFMVHTSIQP